MALIGIAFSIGFVFGPSIGAAFSVLTREEGGETMWFVVPALFALVLSLADLAFMYLCLVETLPEGKRLKSKKFLSNAVQYINPVSLFKFSSVSKHSPKDSASMQSIGTTYFLYLFIYSGLEFTLPFLMHTRFEYSSMQQGKMFFFMGTVMALVQGGYTRRISPGKEAKTAMQGIMILIPAFLLMAFSTSTFFMYFALTLFSIASATVVPSMTTLISIHGGDNEKGTIMGIFRSLGALSRALGPMLASTMYWCFGPHICYTVGASMLVVPLMQISKLAKQKSKAL